MDRRVICHWIGFVVLAMAPVVAPSGAAAGAFGSASAPTNGKPTLGGLMFRAEVNWVQGPGYLPVRVTISDTTPSPGDRTFTIELVGQSYGPGEARVTARQDLECPAGAGSATTSISLPTAGVWPRIECRVWEDGRRVEELTANLAPVNGIQWGSPTRETNALFVVAGEAPKDILPIVEAFGQRGYWSPNANPAGGGTFPPHGAQGIEFISPAELSTKWIDYLSLDALHLRLDDLKDLQANRGPAFDAIRRWAWAGGNLWVSGVAGESQLAELEALVLPRLESGGEIGARWRALSADQRRMVNDAVQMQQQAESVFGASGVPVQAVELDEDGNPVAKPAANGPPSTDPQFRWRTAQLGLVVAIVEADPVGQFTARDWRTIRLACGTHRHDWAARHGMSTTQANLDFWNFLIAGVGLPPVTAFHVMITAFTILIGPVNYWWLRKRRRLHLLLFVVPLSAFAVTLALALYAVLSDGFATQLRSRSYTLLDQPSGESSSWTRLSYYAGLAPSQGLSFSAETAVLPIQYAASGKAFDNSRTVGWSDAQHLASGWLNSRTPTQFLTIRSARSRRGVFVEAAADGGGPRVTNKLGGPIRRLLLCDIEGQPFYGEALPADASATLTAAANNADALRAAMGELRASLPAAPPAMKFSTGSMNSWRRQRRGYAMYGYMNQGAAPTQTTSRLEQSFDGVSAAFARALDGEPGRQSLEVSPSGSELDVREPAPTLRPRRYWAIVERPPDAEFGVASVVEDRGGSFHVVEGAW